MDVSTFGWRFPVPVQFPAPSRPRLFQSETETAPPSSQAHEASQLAAERTRPRPPSGMVVFKDRLLYLLQPPLEDLFAGRQVQLPCKPFPYQFKGIAFLMPRNGALLADEMGLEKRCRSSWP
jgi:hypothetical protein